MMRAEKVGDWDKVHELVHGLQSNMKKAQGIALKRWGLLAEKIAVTHISTQDLGWEPLSPKTIAQKIRKGYSENIYVMSSTYFQSITSWVDKDKVLAGVKKDATNKLTGESLGSIAMWLEYGTETMPSRPLWAPTLKEVKEKIKSDKTLDPVFIFINLLK